MIRRSCFLAVRVLSGSTNREVLLERLWELARLEKCFPRTLDGIPKHWILLEQATPLPGFRGGFQMERWRRLGLTYTIEYVVERGARPGKELFDAIAYADKQTYENYSRRIIDHETKPPKEDGQ